MQPKYLRRINAIAQGGGEYVVMKGYERVTLRVLSDGGVEVPDALPTPTQEERKEIASRAEELCSLTIPISAPAYAGLPKIDSGTLYTYRDREGRVLMCVQRIEAGIIDHEKHCWPWIYDGTKWEKQEWPALIPSPLYGDYHDRMRIMVHEGEKAVDAAVAAADPQSGHPWQEWLARFAHVTWRGGARRAHMADWNSLPRGAEVWIMPDNDEDGYSAAQSVVASMPPSVRDVRLFHHRFFPDTERGWDMADPPFVKESKEVEQNFVLNMKAVDYIPDGDKMIPVIRKEFVQKFAYSVRTQEFVEIQRPLYPISAASFNAIFSHLSTENLAKMVLASKDLARVDQPGYRPPSYYKGEQRAPRFFRSDGGRCVNMYQEPSVQATRPMHLSQIKPFLAYLRYLMPVARERKSFMRWASCYLAGNRLRWAVLMISQRHGTGKSTLMSLLRELTGHANTSHVTALTLADRFTGWAASKQLIVVPELLEGSGFKLGEMLKTMIADDAISIRRMNTDQYDIENHISFVCASNHVSAIHLAKEDRRWFLPKITEQLPPYIGEEMEPDRAKLAVILGRYLKLGKEPKSTEMFAELLRWFNDRGNGHLLWLAREYGRLLHQRGWDIRMAHAPTTERKVEVVERSIPQWEEDIVTALHEYDDPPVVIVQDLLEYLKELGQGEGRGQRAYTVKPGDVSRVLEEQGYLPQFHTPSKGYTVKLAYNNGRQIEGRVFSKYPLEGSWQNHKHAAFTISAKWKLIFGHEAF